MGCLMHKQLTKRPLSVASHRLQSRWTKAEIIQGLAHSFDVSRRTALRPTPSLHRCKVCDSRAALAP